MTFLIFRIVVALLIDVVVGFPLKYLVMIQRDSSLKGKVPTNLDGPSKATAQQRRQWIPNSKKTVSRVTIPSRTNQTMLRSIPDNHTTRKFEYDLCNPLVYVNSHNINELKMLLKQPWPSVLGIDTETKPVRTKGLILPTSIMQIAVRQRFTQNESVVIIDLLDIKKAGKLMILDKILKPVMSDKTILKIGQELKWDIKEVSSAYTELSAFRTVYSILETVVLHRAINPKERHTPSLKNLTLTYLNHELDKTQQLSDWGTRPLSWEQLHYAACDALVLLRLFDAMKSKMGNAQGTSALDSLVTNHVRHAPRKNSAGVSLSNDDYYNVTKPLHKEFLVGRKEALSDNHRDILLSLETLSVKHKSQGKQSFLFYNQFLRFLRTDGIP